MYFIILVLFQIMGNVDVSHQLVKKIVSSGKLRHYSSSSVQKS